MFSDRMAMADQQLRFGVIAGSAVLVAAITYLRFCGSVDLPPKPPPPSGPTGTERKLLSTATGSPEIYKDFLDKDAQNAGVRTPTIDEMSKKLAYRVDEARHVLEPGKPPIELAGLKLHLERSTDAVMLVVQNTIDSDVAYQVSTTPSVSASVCNSARPLPMNAMVLRKGANETRTECVWRDGMSIIVTRVETLEVPPLSAWYLSQVPPALVGIDFRIARGHRGPDGTTCTPVMSQVVRNGIERGDITWRDLADFFARHRCQTYMFPPRYRAFKSDNERPVPAVDPSQ